MSFDTNGITQINIPSSSSRELGTVARQSRIKTQTPWYDHKMDHDWKEVHRIFLWFKDEGSLFMKYMVGKTHSGQYEMGNEDRNSKALETFKNCWYFLSTIDLNWGVSTQLN